MSKNTKCSPKVKGVGSYLSNIVSNVAGSVENTGKSLFAPNSKRTMKVRSQYAAKVSKPSKLRSKVMKRKLRSMQAKKVRKTRSDKGVKRGPRKTM